MLDLAVIITTHRGRLDGRVLEPLDRLAPAEIHIVSSDEQHVGALAVADDTLRVQHHAELLRPGEARNRGAEKTRAGSLLFLDSDVVLTDPALDRIRSFVASDDVEIAGGLYLIQDDEPAAQVVQNAFLAYRFDECQEGRPRVLSTSHLLLKRAAFDAVGGFHELMTSQEDLEFCSRAIDLGFETVLDRELLAWHTRSFSGWSLLADYLRKSYESVGPRMSNRRTMTHAGNNLSRAAQLSFLAPTISLLVMAMLIAVGVTDRLPYAAAALVTVVCLPFGFLRQYLLHRPRQLAYALLLWPWIGLTVTTASAVGALRWAAVRWLRRLRSTADYLVALKRVLIRNGRPIQLIAYCTAVCNLRCHHCFYKETLDSPGRGELDLGLFTRLVDRTSPLLWFSLGGGEPLLRTDLLQLSKLVVGHGRPKLFSFPTSGWFTERTFRYALRLLQSFPDSSTNIALYVSVDGPPEVHDKIRGAGSHQRAMATIERLKLLERWYPHFHVSVVTTITRENALHAEAFVGDLLRLVGPDRLAINLLRYHALEHPPLPEEVVEAFRRAVALREAWQEREHHSGFGRLTSRVLRIKEILQKKIILEVAEKGDYVTPCTAGGLSYVVMEDGRLKSCEILEQDLGNVMDEDIMTLMRSREAAELRSWIRDTRCRCTYECANSTNALFSWPMTWRSIRHFLTPGRPTLDV